MDRLIAWKRQTCVKTANPLQYIENARLEMTLEPLLQNELYK